MSDSVTPHVAPPLLVRVFQFLLAIAFFGLLVWFIRHHWLEVTAIIMAFRQGKWVWLGVALIMEAFYFLAAMQYYDRTLETVGVSLPREAILLMLLGTQAVSVVAPSEFLASQAVFLSGARKYKQSLSQTALGTLLAQLIELFAFLPILVLGLFLLFVHHQLNPYELTATYILLPISIALAIGLIALMSFPHYPAHFLTWLKRLFHIPIADPTIITLHNDLTEAVTAIRLNTQKVSYVFLQAFIAHGLRILCLFFIFRSFGLPAGLFEAIPAYGIGTLIWIVSPIPQGIGIVEGSYALALISLGVTPAAATTIALAYRGIVFWLPLIVGLFALRQLRYSTKITVEAHS